MTRLLKFTSLIVICFLFIYPYQISAAILFPNDPFFSDQWHLQKIQTTSAWEKATGAPEVVVAVLDTGIDLDHPDLASRLWRNPREHLNGKDDDGNGLVDDINGWDFISDDNDPSPDLDANLTRAGVNHGTILAGIIGAEVGNAEGVAGINWRVRIMPVRVLDSQGVGNTIIVEKGIRYALAAGADIINLSFVGKTFSQSLYDTVLEAWSKNVVVVAAVGNNAANKNLDESPVYPACFSGPANENIILGVAATDRDDHLAGFSNFGNNCVDVSAPGVGIFSTQFHAPLNTIFREKYGGGWSGTSAAAASVSGVVALVKSYNRDLRASEIIRLVSENSENIDKLNLDKIGKIGQGRLNAFLALQATEDYLLGQGRSFIRQGEILASPVNSRKTNLRIYESGGHWVGDLEAYNAAARQGLSVASGDVNADGFRELATLPLGGAGPHLRLWRSDGKLADEFFVYEKEFMGGARVVFANLDGSGSEQLVTVPGPGREVEVRVWKRDGTLFSRFSAFPENYIGGANLAVADFDGDGMEEIIVAPSGVFSPEVRVFRPDGILVSKFLALPASFRGGLQVVAGDLNGDGYNEILTMPERGSPQIRVWNFVGRELRPAFFLGAKWERGVRVALGDTDNDGRAEIVTSSDRNSRLTARIYGSDLRLKKEFRVYPYGQASGVHVAIVE